LIILPKKCLKNAKNMPNFPVFLFFLLSCFGFGLFLL